MQPQWLGADSLFDYCKTSSYNGRRIISWTRMVFRDSHIARDGAIRRTGLDRRIPARFGGPNMDTPRALDDDILYIRDEPAPPRAVRRFLRALRWISVAGAIALVAWVTTVAINAGVQESRRIMCANQIRQLGLALSQYQEANGQFPAPALAGRDGSKLLSWRVAILPELGYESLYERFHLDEPWDSPHNRSLLSEMPQAFACPGGPERRAGETSYLVVVGPETDAYTVNTPFEPTRGADIRHITDGSSGTILVMETDARVPWTKPDDLHWTKGEPLPRVASSHAGGAHVVFADGVSRFIKVVIEPRILEGLLTINGGEVLSAG
jgi:prepilin-type processing-associated H-X9-DG protein